MSRTSRSRRCWCLGDLVGYGAQPDDCVQLARDRCDLSLAGNHDLVVTGDITDRGLLRQRGRGRPVDPGDDRRGDDGRT